MKLLRITAEGLPLFKSTLDLQFYAKQRVSEDQREQLFPLFSNVYLNPANGFIGINASGKTSVLKVILLVLGIINNEPINHIESRDILGESKEVKFNIFFYSKKANEVCRLETIITSNISTAEEVSYSIVSESLWRKNANTISTRKAMLDFPLLPSIVRNTNEDYLPNDVSILIAQNKRNQEHVQVVSLLMYTDINYFLVTRNISVSSEIISYLDPTIERLIFDEKDKKTFIRLKFKGKDEILLNNPIDLNNYLSSGTIKGMRVFSLALEVIQSGGYLIVDEIENHFNKEIVTTLLRFFMEHKVNKNGGTLVFSTHYPELLDEFERNDNLFITKNLNGITVENLSNILKRNDIKKSDAYQSDFLKGTAPSYEKYMKLRKSFLKAFEGR